MFYTEEQKRATRNTLKNTRESLTTIDFSNNDILKIITYLDANKAHGHDMISIRMVKICDEFVYKLWKLFFESCLESGKFPGEWKKVNVFPIHKTSGKQKIKNYRPTLLLPITGKILESFEFFTENNLISDNQSCFKPGDLCINQLLSITLEFINILMIILKSEQFFYEFNKVWHKGLIYKLKQNGISGNILSTIIDFLSFRKQRIVLNGQGSQWTSIESGVPQWSILVPLLFFINIYELSDELQRLTWITI